MIDFLLFIASLLLVIRGATLATKYSAKLAESFHLSKYVVGFMVVAFISILPEALIAISSSLKEIPSFGLGTLLGSNVADLTLIVAILIFYAGRGIKIESRVLKNIGTYPFFLMLPIALGLNGHFSRIDGFVLVTVGAFFYYATFKRGTDTSSVLQNGDNKLKNTLFLLFALSLLLVGSHFTVTYATALAHTLAITPILIGLLVVSLGTTMPELFFSLKSIQRKDDTLAIGDVLGTVLADATILVGVLALMNPFYFPVRIIYVAGAFMVIASLVLLKFMETGRTLSRKEGILLLGFWICYVVVELTMR